MIRGVSSEQRRSWSGPVADRWARPRIVDVLLVFTMVFGIYFAGDVSTSLVIELVLAMFWFRRPLLPAGNLPVGLLALLFVSLAYSTAIYLGNAMLDMSYPLRFSRSIVAFAASACLTSS